MATITFKAKAVPVSYADDSHAFTQIKVPQLERHHCDMASFRKHPRYSGIANSDLFKNALARIRRDVAPSGFLKLESLPANVRVDTSGFLASVTIEV